MDSWAGKRLEYNSGTNNPEAMIKIDKDLRCLSCRNHKVTKESNHKNLKRLTVECQTLSANISKFQAKQKKDFEELKNLAFEVQKLINFSNQ